MGPTMEHLKSTMFSIFPAHDGNEYVLVDDIILHS